VDVFVPRNAVAGQYAGTYTVTSSQGSAGGQILLNAWNFILPLQPSLKSSFGIWNSFNMATYETLLVNRLMPDYGSPYLSMPQQITLTNSYGLRAVDLGVYSGATYGDCQMSPAPSVSNLQAVARHRNQISFCTTTAPMKSMIARISSRVLRSGRGICTPPASTTSSRWGRRPNASCFALRSPAAAQPAVKSTMYSSTAQGIHFSRPLARSSAARASETPLHLRAGPP
jgi:hypothetical protein